MRLVPPGDVLALLANSNLPNSSKTRKRGRAIYNALRCGSLLCNLRRGAVQKKDAQRLHEWLQSNWTVEGACLAPFRHFSGCEALCACEDYMSYPVHLALPGQRLFLVHGIQVATVSRDGSTRLNLAFGHIAYTSWQPIHPTDPFPLHATAFIATLIAASTANMLRQRGISLSAPLSSILWKKFPAPPGTTVGDVVRGAGPWSQAPTSPSAKRLSDLQAMLKWLENAPAANGSCPPWWPPTAHAAVCAALLQKAGSTPSAALQSFFAQASRPCFKATMSPVQISKPVMSVESAEVEAAQDTIVASLGADEMRCMHLADAVLAVAVMCFVGKLAFTPSLPAGLGRSAKMGEAARQRSLMQRSADGSYLNGYGPAVAYAKALREAAQAKGEAATVMEDVMKIKAFYEDESIIEDLSLVQNDFNLTSVERADKILAMVKPLKSTVMPKFVTFIAKKMRLKALKPICLEYVQAAFFKESVAPVRVTSAVRLSEEQKNKIIDKMKVKCETDSIKLIEEVDANLISGFKLEWGFIDPVNLDAPSNGVDLTLRNILNKKALQVGGLVDAL
ncbi:atpD [Symbiodinium pilosum]|uniref:AtpD protein n=1 Tax=Symbiodinium pilosum TaxID=2952 RepID=A0A812LC38_SYMPI|nr:atpD [Symbiodinium pilosum]